MSNKIKIKKNTDKKGEPVVYAIANMCLIVCAYEHDKL